MTRAARRPPSWPIRAAWTAYLARHLRGQARFPFRSPEMVRRAQAKRVGRMMRHAYATVPHYRRALDRLGLAPEDFRSADDLARLPILEPKDIQRRADELVSNRFARDRLLEVRSGGSTGAPRSVYHDPGALLQNAAHGERERSIVAAAVGRSARYREAVIASPLGTAEEVQRFVRERILLPPGVGIERAYFSLLDPPVECLRRLNDFRPDVIHAYGSYLGRLFQTLEESGAPFHRPRIVTYSSDGLAESARRRIVETFAIPVLATYQAVEAFKIGFTCEASSDLHLNADLYPVRIVDERGEPVPDGETGSVIVSNLVNRGMVLLNYRLGDRAALVPGPCPCGRTLPRLTLPVGRDDDWVVLPDGGRLHPQAIRILFTDEREVWEYQVVQEAPRRFRVAIVAAPGCDRAAARERIAGKFEGRLGPETAVEIAYVDALDRTPGGKAQPFIALDGERRR